MGTTGRLHIICDVFVMLVSMEKPVYFPNLSAVVFLLLLRRRPSPHRLLLLRHPLSYRARDSQGDDDDAPKEKARMSSASQATGMPPGEAAPPGTI
eukprot:9489375-Pyramimonas_sp.AAC.1